MEPIAEVDSPERGVLEPLAEMHAPGDDGIAEMHTPGDDGTGDIQEPWSGPSAGAFAAGVAAALQTLMSGQRKEVREGSIQAHVCVIRSPEDVEGVMQAFQSGDSFSAVASWAYAWRLSTAAMPGMEAGQQRCLEEVEDGLDEGVGEKILAILRRFNLQGLLLVVSRWQDYGASPGMDFYGTVLYGQVIERCKDLITNLREAMGLGGGSMFVGMQEEVLRLPMPEKPGRKQTFDFSFLPSLPEPKAPTKYGPKHFLSDTSLNRPPSLPNLFSGGDVRLWVANDQSLKQLSEADLWSLRSIRQPDWRIEEVLQAVAVLRGQKIYRAAGTPAARWGHCKEVLKSPTLRTELLLFDADAVPLEDAHSAHQLLEGLDVEDIRRASPGAAALFEWAQGVVRWRLNGPPPEASSQWLPTPAGSAPMQPLMSLHAKEVAAPIEMRSSAPAQMRRSASAPRALRATAAGFNQCRSTVPRKRIMVGLGATLAR